MLHCPSSNEGTDEGSLVQGGAGGGGTGGVAPGKATGQMTLLLWE